MVNFKKASPVHVTTFPQLIHIPPTAHAQKLISNRTQQPRYLAIGLTSNNSYQTDIAIVICRIAVQSATLASALPVKGAGSVVPSTRAGWPTQTRR
jgi:hypothetical protein